MNQQKRRHSVTILVPSSLAQQKCSLVNLLLIKNLILNTGLFVCKCPLTQQKNSFLHMQMRTKRMHRIHTRFSPSIATKEDCRFFFVSCRKCFLGGGRLFNFLQVYLKAYFEVKDRFPSLFYIIIQLCARYSSFFSSLWVHMQNQMQWIGT